MPPASAAHRLSPRVRRLLAEHDLAARAVPGTGAGGRVRADDVLRAAGVPRSGAGRLLASPLARRVLRDAGVALDELAPRVSGGPLTRDRAERLLAEDGPPAAAPTAEDRSGPAPSHVSVDVTVLLVELSRARGLLSGRGPGPGLAAAVASAAAPLLEDGELPAVALHLPGDGATVRPVADAADCTVGGLERRAAATPGVAVAGGDVAVLVVTETGDPVSLLAAGSQGVLHVGAPEQQQVEGTDPSGLPVTATRYVVELRLHGGRGDGLLGEVQQRCEAWTHPVG